jgi:septum formation protein
MDEVDRGTELILASGSPRRARLLGEIVSSFRIVPSRVEEDRDEGEDPRAYVMRVSKKKAESVADALEPGNARCWVLAGDTVVVVEGTLLGKPTDAEQARRMLERLQDRRHEVVTGICLMNRGKGICRVEAVGTWVWMRRIEPPEMEAYIRSGEPFDKAGGYAIQGEGGRFICGIEGSYTNVVGLPVERVQEWFRVHGIL